PAWTRTWPGVAAATEAGVAATGAGVAGQATEGAASPEATAPTASPPTSPASAVGAGSGRGARTMVLDGAATGASTGGASGADTVRGASTSAEYSRTRRPCPQSASTRKLSMGSWIGSTVVTRITGWPSSLRARLNRSSATMPCGGWRPMRAKVSGDASPTRKRSSSPGTLETTGISASSGSPRPDLRRICPRPSAATAWLASSSRAATAMRNPLFTFTRGPPLAGTLAATAPPGNATTGKWQSIGASAPRRHHPLCQLHGIQRRTLADVVGDNPKRQPAWMRNVLADAADVDRIVPRRVRGRGRITAVTGLVDHLDSRRPAQQLPRRVGRELLPRLDMQRLGVAVEHRDADHGGVHPDRVVAQDPPGLVDQLHLLRGVAVVTEPASMGEDVEGDPDRVHLRFRFAEVEHRRGLASQLLQRAPAGAGDRLVGGDIDPFD